MHEYTTFLLSPLLRKYCSDLVEINILHKEVIRSILEIKHPYLEIKMLPEIKRPQIEIKCSTLEIKASEIKINVLLLEIKYSVLETKYLKIEIDSCDNFRKVEIYWY